jgi:hypothetical protein
MISRRRALLSASDFSRGRDATRYFGDQQLNVWVTYPAIRLPAVLVLGALAGHLAIFRTLSGPTGRDRR